MPRPDSQTSNGQANYNRTTSIQDAADLFMTKLDHKFSDKISLSGVYLQQDRRAIQRVGRQLVPGSGRRPLLRRIHVGVVNNTWIPNSNTVVTVRYGQTSFVDNCGIAITEFDPSTLGFAPAFLNTIVGEKFPRLNVDDYGEINVNAFGAGAFTAIDWNSWGFNGTVSKLVGSHTFKMERTTGGSASSRRRSDRVAATSRSAAAPPPTMPAWAATVSPASCWARRRPGSPTSPRPASTTPTTTAATFRTTGAKSNFTFNYGLRIEHEDGLREKSNQFTVGFDQGLVSPLSGTAPGLAAIRGTNEILGGLMYAGVDGNNTYQGDPPE